LAPPQRAVFIARFFFDIHCGLSKVVLRGSRKGPYRSLSKESVIPTTQKNQLPSATAARETALFPSLLFAIRVGEGLQGPCGVMRTAIATVLFHRVSNKKVVGPANGKRAEKMQVVVLKASRGKRQIFNPGTEYEFANSGGSRRGSDNIKDI